MDTTPTPPSARPLTVAPGPHISEGALTTRRMMVDVLLALLPVLAAAIWVFRMYAVVQAVIGVGAALAAEALFTALRRKPLRLTDGSAAVTGLILALSLPPNAPWYVGAIGAFAAIGLAKVIYGGLGQNVFNPAMVGRAFVMIAFPSLVGAAAYVIPGGAVDAVTHATPLTALKMQGEVTALQPLFLGTVNGSVGETSALACLLGGLYLCLRRTASWEIPAGVLAAVLVFAGLPNVMHPSAAWSVAHELCGGALLFGAFFIATDPVTSPLTHRGKFGFGVGVGALVLLIRRLSGYPEGVMFSVLMMNAMVPLINRWTVPVPVGGPAPAPVKK